MPSVQEEWVNPYYLALLHGNFLDLGDEERKAFIASMQRAITRIDENIIERLLRIAWREQLTGAWFAGLKGSSQFTERIGDLLIDNSGGYAGEGYCFALARFATSSSTDYLTLYLDENLLRLENEWNQDWAIAALLWIDETRRTRYAQSNYSAVYSADDQAKQSTTGLPRNTCSSAPNTAAPCLRSVLM